MDLDRLTLRMVLLQRLSDRLQKELTAAREELKEALGTEGRRLAQVDNYRLGTVSVTKKRAKIMKTEAFLDWAEENYPDQVETKTVTTREVSAVLESGIKWATESAGQPCDPRGELDIPGVSLVDGYLTHRAAPGSAEAIAHLWQQGRLRDVIDVTTMLEEGTHE